ncbi:hypothetical protein ACIPYS_09615 [Kitasatospora sp. NPDC089913]|uniref:hypothetical protein n=1 Tax=Kitasatospora sp. NPDC089913 TaxID=3364080 RepID=UPI00382A1BB5
MSSERPFPSGASALRRAVGRGFLRAGWGRTTRLGALGDLVAPGAGTPVAAVAAVAAMGAGVLEQPPELVPTTALFWGLATVEPSHYSRHRAQA